nr:hypothetical protein PJ912_15285 [Pectobacterium colocasium]
MRWWSSHATLSVIFGRGTLPTVTAWNNGQFVLVAKVINSSLALVAGTFNGQIAVVQALAQGAAVPEAKGLAVPIGGQITALFNQNSNYAQFLLNAIIPRSGRFCSRYTA